MIKTLKAWLFGMAIGMIAMSASALQESRSLDQIDKDLDTLKDDVGQTNEDLKSIADEMTVLSGQLCLGGKKDNASYCAPSAISLAERNDPLAEEITQQAIVKLLSIGCGLGEGSACVAYAHPAIHSRFSSQMVLEKAQQGIKILGPACQENDAISCKDLSDGIWWVSQIRQLPEQLRVQVMPASLKRSCDLGLVGGCLQFATALADGTHGLPQNAEAAKQIRTQLCDRDVHAACIANSMAENK